MKTLLFLFLVSLSFSVLPAQKMQEEMPIGYRQSQYNLKLGQNWDRVKEALDWSWAGEMDEDGKIDPELDDAYMNLSQPLINHKGENFLPALFIQVQGGKLQSFTCSMLFHSDTAEEVEEILNSLETSIPLLRDASLRQKLYTNGVFVINGEKHSTHLKLVQKEGAPYDKFEYNVFLSK